MKNTLADIYDQILLNEAEKSELQNPGRDEIGSLKTKQDLFGEKPKVVEGPDKAKLQQGPSYVQTTGSAAAKVSSHDSAPKGFKGSAPAKNVNTESPKEMENEKVDPTNEEDEDEEKKDKNMKKKETHSESLTLNAFETLFKKTLSEEFESQESNEEMNELEFGDDAESEETSENSDESETENEEDEGDLLSDLHKLQDHIAEIISKLEGAMEDGMESEEGSESEEYSEEDFDSEFGDDTENEEESFKESMDKPKPLNSGKGKTLMSKKNKIGRVTPKGGKAHSGNLKNEPTPKALGDKKSHLQAKKSEVKSTIKKGDFIK